MLDRQRGQIGRFDQSPRRYDSEYAAISPDQHWLARLNDHHYLEVFELPSLKRKHSLGRHYFTSDLTWRSDSAQLAVAAGDGVYLWDIGSGMLERYLKCKTPSAVAYSPDGRYLAEGLRMEASVCLWDLETSEQVAKLASYGKEWVVLAPDGRFDASENAGPYLLHVNKQKRTPGLLSSLWAR